MKQSKAVRIPEQTTAEKPEKDLRFLGAAALGPVELSTLSCTSTT